jgi:hypothetical protein
MNINLSIERVVLDGVRFGEEERNRFAETLRGELAAHCAGIDPGRIRQNANAERIQVPTFTGVSITPDALGREAARALIRGITQ